MTFYRFKRDTKEYDVMVNYYATIDKWNNDEAKKMVSEFFGFDIDWVDTGVYCDASQLTMWGPPENIKHNFKKPDWQGNHLAFECKKSSKLNKDWVKFCNEVGLRTIKQLDWAWELEWVFGDKACAVHKIDSDFYVEPTTGKFDKDEFLETIDNATFYDLKADQARKSE